MRIENRVSKMTVNLDFKQALECLGSFYERRLVLYSHSLGSKVGFSSGLYQQGT